MSGERWAEPRGSLRHPLLWWDLGVSVTLAALTLMTRFTARSEPSPEWAGGVSPAIRAALLLGPLAVFGIIYLALGRRVLRRAMQDETSGAGVAFLALLLAALAWAVFTEPMYALLQALVYPIVWSIVPRYRDAVLWSAAIALGVSLAMFAGIAQMDPRDGLLSATFTGPLSFAFAVVMGKWITRIYERGEQHRVLAEQLRSSQAEVAALSEEAGAAAERERLSRELHDTLTQTLTGLVMLSEQADRALVAGDAVRARDRLARVSLASRTAVEEARALVATTQPLADGGLEQTLERVAARFAADTGMEVRCEVAPLDLDRERQVVLLRAAQEGLANARKHSRASRVGIVLTEADEGGVVLVVEDDGMGPDHARSEVGFGLWGLEDRVRAVGGSVAFGPGETGGARLEVRMPEQGAAR